MTSEQHPAIVKEILRCEVGSSAHGVNLPGADDLDLMGIAVEGKAYVLGLSHFETYLYRTAAEREGRADAPSRAGDIELTIHSLRKFARLAAKGNPSILMALFAPVVTTTAWGEYLRNSSEFFVSKDAGKAFVGYMQAQRERLLGLRGQKNVKRPELVEKYGFDTKYAMHLLRLGYQGREMMLHGAIPIPLCRNVADYLLAVRVGSVPLECVLQESRDYEDDIKKLLARPGIQEHANLPQINRLLADIYEEVWSDEDFCYADSVD